MTNATPPSGTHMTMWGYGPNNRNGSGGMAKRYANFSYGAQTGLVWPGDSGGPVIRGDNGAIVRVNSAYTSSAPGKDYLAPLNASWDWIQTTVAAID